MAEYEDLREWSAILEKDVLVLNTTMTCPLSCSFCCYGCHPKRQERMPLPLAIDLIDQAATLSCFSSIGFTGGEPLFYRDDFNAMVERCALHALPFTVATSGHWGRDPAEAEEVAAFMVSRGLRRANISCDPSHAEFVSPAAVKHAAAAIAARGVPVYVVGTFDTPGMTLKNFVPDLIDAPNVFLIDKVVSKIGRATKWDVDYEAIVGPKVKTCYRRVHHDIVVFWDGKAYPCCSTFNRATPGLVIGDLTRETLADVRNRLDASLLFRVIKREGFPEFYRIIEQFDPELLAMIPSFDAFPGACSACHGIMKNGPVAERVRAAFEAYRQTEIEKTLSRVADLLGESSAADFYEKMLETCSS